MSFLTEAESRRTCFSARSNDLVGRRDHTLFATAVQAGLRASELIGLRITDVHPGVGPHIRCIGKGRKPRITPLTRSVVALLRAWFSEWRDQVNNLVFTTRTGRMLSRDALEHRLAECVAKASDNGPSLREKRITIHVLRHTAAMRLLQAGIDLSIKAPWPGHEQMENYADLPSRGPRPQGKGTRQDHSGEYQSRSLPTTRYTPCIP